MLVRDYANLNVVCCEPDAPIAEVAALMRLALDVDPKMFSAAELMSSPVTTVQEDASLNEALGVMRGKKIRRLPVVNRAGGLFGMITSDDVINLIASELSMVAGLIVEQPIRESRLRK